MVNAVAVERSSPSLGPAYAQCERLARGHYENFPVASFLLPKHMRRGIAAIYAFARRADDFADEPGYTDAERLRLLDDWNGRLHACLGPTASSNSTDDLIFLALADTIRAHRLPLSLFEDLLSAFRQDVTVKRYRSWNDVLDYCSRSANPVGRLVLRVAGYDDASLDSASDALCTALQLTNFWQDFAGDWANGRLYVPLDDRDRAGARDADLNEARMTPQWRLALGVVASRTRDLFTAGRPVCDAVIGRLKLELRVTWLGGSRILDRLDQANYDVFGQRPTLLSVPDFAALLWRALTWKAT
jgi:hydroxysqualene synthase